MNERSQRRLLNESSQLAALLTGLFAVSALVLGVTAYWIADRAMRAEVHDFIDAGAGAVLSGYRSEGRAEAIEVVQQLSAVPGLWGRYLLQSPEGHWLAGNLAALPPRTGLFEVLVAPAGSAKLARHRGEGQRADVALGEGRFLPDRSYLFVGEDTRSLVATRERILGAFAWIIGATVLLALAGGALLTAGFLRRIDAITRTCRAVVAGRFGDRIPVAHSQTQLDRLSATINEMLDRIASLMESLRQMSSDIAHDLRTPLTRLRQRLESVRGTNATIADYELVVERALGECDVILAVFSALLRISQIESGKRRANFTRVALPELLQRVAELYAPVVEDGQQTLRVELCEALEVQGDETLLMQMLSNLVENAIRHAGRGASIRLECRAGSGEALVRVIDSGPGIPAGERDRVFDRLYRLERSRNTPGHGLGLSLVAAIAKLHGYTVELTDAGPGLSVTLRMPLAAKDEAGPAPLPARGTQPRPASAAHSPPGTGARVPDRETAV
jgi:signal transduction histidine kinase